jgi:hypothetical protein
VIEPLGDHDLTGFRCGQDEPDTWLIAHARTALGQGTRTYLLVVKHVVASGRVVVRDRQLTTTDVTGAAAVLRDQLSAGADRLHRRGADVADYQAALRRFYERENAEAD